nr:isoform 2 of sugar transporter erd6-like 3 [Quercus suber]
MPIAISLPSKENYDMGRESIEEGDLSTILVARDEHHQVYGSGTSSGDHVCANTTGCDDGGESQSGSSSARGEILITCSVAQTGIMDDLGLAVAEYSLFGSILTIGAMVGAIVSGKIADCIDNGLFRDILPGRVACHSVLKAKLASETKGRTLEEIQASLNPFSEG